MVVVFVEVFVEGCFSACCEATLAGVWNPVVLSVSVVEYVFVGFSCVCWFIGFVFFCGCPVTYSCG